MKQLRHTIFLAIGLALATLPALAADSGLDAKIQAVRNLHPSLQSFNEIEVPSAGNPFSDMLVVASLRGGVNSTASDAIIEMMVRGTAPLVVVGKSDKVAEATLERALQDGKDKLQGKSVIFVGAEEYREPLQKAAQSAGIDLEFIPTP